MNTSPARPTLPFDQSQRKRKPGGVRAVVTGQVGLDKADFLTRVVEFAADIGEQVELFNVGERMCAEAPDIDPKRILDLPRQRLTALRRSVFKDILAFAKSGKSLIVNTHATFRWKHGLFHAFDHNQLVELDPDLFITLVDNVDAVHERLERDHEIRHTLKDILVWREEETVVTDAMAEAISGFGTSYVVSRGTPDITAKSIARLMFEPERRRVYPSFPMTHVLDRPKIMREIEAFRAALGEHFIAFDPADVDEKRLLFEAERAVKAGEKEMFLEVNGRRVAFDPHEVNHVAGDIDGQIYARDFKLIEQSDMICSFIPAGDKGEPLLSSGVERELQHAFEATREVYVIWPSAKPPSPFVTETATEIFPDVPALFAHFQKKGYIGDFQLDLL